MVLDRLQPLGLPAEQLVGEPFERLAEHDEPARLRVAGAKVQVRQPAAPPAVTPLHREHHEVQRVPWLDLDPSRASAARLVGGLQRLDHDAFVALGDGFLEEFRGFFGCRGDQAGHAQVLRHHALKVLRALRAREVDKVGSVRVQYVEQEHRERRTVLPGRLGGGPRGGVLERQRPPVFPQRDELTVQDRS